jgi:hypothetical protein
VRFEPSFPAAFYLHLDDIPTTDATAELYAEFLKAARAGGVEAFFHSSEYPAAQTFTLPPSSTLAANFNFSGGSYPSSMRLASAASFPASGSVLLAYTDDALQKRFSYTSKTATTLEGVTPDEGTSSSFSAGGLVVGVPQPYSTLADNFESPFPSSMPVADPTVFPDAGHVALDYGTSNYRVFSYSGKTPTTLESVAALSYGSGTVFSQDTLVAGVFLTLNGDPDTEESVGGYLSTVKEA